MYGRGHQALYQYWPRKRITHRQKALTIVSSGGAGGHNVGCTGAEGAAGG